MGEGVNLPRRYSIVPIMMQTEPKPPQHACLCLTLRHFGSSLLRGSVLPVAVEEEGNGDDKRLVKLGHG
jgi:hypothetical protein